MIYLDWASTSPPDEVVLAEAAALAASVFGNPSSKHQLGETAKARLDEARALLASAIEPAALPRGGSSPTWPRIAFTGSGSEADAIPLLAMLRQALEARRDSRIKNLHLVASEIEHPAIYEEARLLKSLGIGLSLVKPAKDGRLRPESIAGAMTADTALVCVMAVNNETGAIQPIAEIAAAVASTAKTLGRPCPRIHVDAVQALGKLPFSPASLGISSAAFSAHKIRGPRGVGALWSAQGIEALAVGGAQEGGTRAGTENLQGAWAFACCARRHAETMERRYAGARALETRLIEGLAALGGALPLPLGRAGMDERYSPYILSIAFPGLSGEVLARALADEGIAVSTGSACASNARHKGRRVLDAMGLESELGFSAIRISTGESTKAEDIDRFLETAHSLYRKLKP